MGAGAMVDVDDEATAAGRVSAAGVEADVTSVDDVSAELQAAASVAAQSSATIRFDMEKPYFDRCDDPQKSQRRPLDAQPPALNLGRRHTTSHAVILREHAERTRSAPEERTR